MQVRRSHTLRNKSRSPAPPTPTQQTPRPFLPPSHYAAAGGFNTRIPVSYLATPNSEPLKHRRDHPEPSSPDSSIISAAEELPPQRPDTQITCPGFPDLEAQLLPSLRDTVDRMTLTPSRNSTHFKRNETKRTHRSQSRKNSPETRNETSLRPIATTTRESPTYLPEPSTPSQSTPTMGSPSLHLKTAPKSALKSALRSPIPISSSPKPQQLKSQQPITNSPSTTTGSSLRSMKSLLSRKCSGTLKSPFNNTKTRKEVREAISQDEVQTGFEAETPTIQPLSKKFHSSIPRPQEKHYNTIRLEDSDPESRYEVDLRDRRKLTVANAEVFVSGSSSESDADSRRCLYMEGELNTGRNRKRDDRSRSPVGLGLSFPREIPARRHERRHQESLNLRQEPTRPSSQEKTLRFSLPVSESVGSSYSDEFNTYRPKYSAGDNGLDHTRGRPENLDIRGNPPVSSLPDNIYDRTSPRSRRNTSSARSPAFSASTEEETMDDETESEREGYSFRPSKTKDSRRRSSSCGPRFSTFPQQLSEDGAIPIVPARPRSAAPHKPPSPHTARIFPENLRELIKSRNSFSKLPPSTPKEPLQPVLGSTFRRASPDTGERRGEHQKSQKRGEESSYPASTSRSCQQENHHERQYSQGQSEASAIAYGYRSAAARERMAFGIPPSHSDEVLGTTADEQLSHTESNTSSLNQTMWQADSEDLSADAENIFKAIDYSKNKERQRQQRIHGSTPRFSVVSPTLSAPSTYDTHAEHHSPRTPKQEDPPKDSAPFSAQEAPKTREGVIQEIFETEEDLLRLFHICMRIFILPLRIQDSRSWIAGVPPNVAKLLDWFDDIVNLHEQIYQSLCSARDTMSPATDRVSESLRCFVLNVEVYQPYLVRLADVSAEITTLVDSLNTDFGEFISIQQRSSECEGWTLDGLLMLPVNRLAAYQDMFARMLDLTPKTHQDYLSTFSLSRSTDMVIRVMTEVKIREDEYNLLKAFASRIQGLSSQTNLAARERRLLHSGPLALVISDKSIAPESTFKPRSYQQISGANRLNRGSRLLDTIGNSSRSIFERSHSAKTTSRDTSFSAGVPVTSTPVKSTSWFSRLPLRKQSRSKPPLPTVQSIPDRNDLQYSPLTTLQSISVHAFVFNDLVLLAQPGQTSGDEPQWILSQDLGIFRPLSISRLEAKSVEEETIISLETMVLDPEHLSEGIDFRLSSLRTVDFVFSSSLHGHSGDNPTDLDNNAAFHQAWLMAFRQCSQTTLRKFTFPGLPHQGDFLSGSDSTLDTRLAISSLVASGLPIPRSPSGTFPDMHGIGNGTFGGNEREERGWWSLRYQQIFQEFQRRDSLLSDDDDSVGI